jgi:hypothetical protein
VQAAADAEYFTAVCGDFSEQRHHQIEAAVLRAYRWQYIVSGVQHPRFATILRELVSAPQLERIGAPIM